jgi:hypothetical protein
MALRCGCLKARFRHVPNLPLRSETNKTSQVDQAYRYAALVRIENPEASDCSLVTLRANYIDFTYLARRLHHCVQQGFEAPYVSDYVLALFYTLIVA